MSKVNYSVVNLKGKTFKGENNTVCEIQAGYGLYIEGKGFVSFAGANTTNNVKTPYVNTREVLQSIIDQGGLTDFSNVEFID